MRFTRHHSRGMLIALALLLATGCAGSRAQLQPEVPPRHTFAEFHDEPYAVVYDPWESFNRRMYQFNFYLDKYLFLPVVSGYEYVTPVFLQDRISNFYNNLAELRNFSNSVFQLKAKESAKTLGRFVTNSTIGLGGLFDPATSIGLDRTYQDFGKTLGYWGVDSGPYLVLPVFGPSSARDAGGLAVDSGITYGVYTLVDPFRGSDNEIAVSAGIETLNAIDTRHQQAFRYWESGFPFEYYLVRFIYHEKRDIESGRTKNP